MSDRLRRVVTIDELIERAQARMTAISLGEPAPNELQPKDVGSDGDPDCPRCGGNGWYRESLSIKDPLFGIARPCPCLKAMQRARVERALWPEVELPDRGVLSRMSFGTWKPRDHLSPDQRRILASARDAAESFAAGTLARDILILFGPSGTGKTHLLVSIVRRAQELGIPAKFAPISQFLDELRWTNREGSEETEEQVRARYEAFPILCLDELGVQRDTGYAGEQLDRLFNARYSDELPTALALNVDVKTLPMRIADRITDKERMSDHWFDVLSYRSGRDWGKANNG